MTISLLWIIGFSPFYVMLDSNSNLNWTKFTASVSLFFLFALFNFIWNKKSTYKTEILWNDNETNSFVKIFTYICTCHALSLSSFVFFYQKPLIVFSIYLYFKHNVYTLAGFNKIGYPYASKKYQLLSPSLFVSHSAV